MSSPEIGIDFGFDFFHSDVQERMHEISQAGFDDVMIWWKPEGDYTPCQLFDLAQKEHLRMRTVHFPTGIAADLWRDGEVGAAYEALMLRTIREASERGIENLVVHTTRRLITPEPNEIGAERVRRAIDLAEKCSVNLAWENTRFLRYNQYLYDHVISDRMRFCFDAGHANTFTPGEDPLGRFGDKMVVMHLHDNDGSADQHRMPGMGTIDYDKLMKRLHALHPSVYNLEVRMTDEQMETMSNAQYLDLILSDLRGRIARAAQ